jgi:hypothetical protein
MAQSNGDANRIIRAEVLDDTDTDTEECPQCGDRTNDLMECDICGEGYCENCASECSRRCQSCDDAMGADDEDDEEE